MMRRVQQNVIYLRALHSLHFTLLQHSLCFKLNFNCRNRQFESPVSARDRLKHRPLVGTPATTRRPGQTIFKYLPVLSTALRPKLLLVMTLLFGSIALIQNRMDWRTKPVQLAEQLLSIRHRTVVDLRLVRGRFQVCWVGVGRWQVEAAAGLAAGTSGMHACADPRLKMECAWPGWQPDPGWKHQH
jgi:hypothetical protein